MSGARIPTVAPGNGPAPRTRGSGTALRRHRVAAFLLPAVVAATLAAHAEGGPQAVAGHWKGAIQVPGGELEFDVDLRVTAGGVLSGDVSIPAQGAFDLELADLAVAGASVRFRIPGIPGDPSFDGTLAADGGRVEGSFRQGGAELTFSMDRAEGATATAQAALEGFDQLVERAVDAWGVPGLGIAVVSGGEVVYAKGFGRRDLEAGEPMTPDTLFAIGSTTKAMTATTLGMLVDEGKVSWDEPVRTYLPWFALSDPSISERITVLDLVTHRSGLPRHDLLWYNYNQGTREDLARRLAHLELTADLRERYQYNNLMFMTAGVVIETLTGKSWEQNVRERLFEPLGMSRSNFSVLESQRDEDFAQPYRERESDRKQERIPFRQIDLVGPAGSVNSSVNEMAKWLLFNLRRGKVGERQLIQTGTLDQIQTPQMAVPGKPDRPDVSSASYGMGWRIDSWRGHRRLQHGGGIDGFITAVVLYPDDDLGIVAFTNTGSGLPALIASHAADRMLGLERVDWSGEALERVEKAREAGEAAEQKKETTRRAGTHPSHPIADYPGEYWDPGYGTLRIEAGSGEGLWAVINGIRAPLERWHYDVWSGADAGEGDPTLEDRKFLFRGDFDGNVAAVEVVLDQIAGPVVFTRRADPKWRDPEYLTRFVGTYTFAVTGERAVVELAGAVLTATIPGQPRYTLEPTVDGRFALVGLQDFKVGFEQDTSGKVTKAMFYQPDGVFEATRAEE